MMGTRAKKYQNVQNGEQRIHSGIIVTLANEDRSRWRTLHYTGRTAVADMAAACDRLPGRWYVEAISTPDTIYRDTIGEPGPVYLIERQYLSKIRRPDLLRAPFKHPERKQRDETKEIGWAWRRKRLGSA